MYVVASGNSATTSGGSSTSPVSRSQPTIVTASPRLTRLHTTPSEKARGIGVPVLHDIVWEQFEVVVNEFVGRLGGMAEFVDGVPPRVFRVRTHHHPS
jgi:hypothetical protein